ncbi:polyphosphate kinase 1 [Niabella sp. CC-SYL272]|uniref:polyphosphate kinase 1 n=1 Tax=Niabella agricola TaxID=2891571 RepID=UPI001F2B739B|nr:polyphosphate kinase 1 [Niabella agricola]MCF3108429.1 polyphosphate kinase 1 [Niabella agricola]
MQKVIPRDISWLAFNGRVLQEAADPTVPLNERIKFLGIFSNNRDEFFRVRIASLKRMLRIESKLNMHPEKNPKKILDQIQRLMTDQQEEFERVWKNVQRSLNRNKIYLKTEAQLTVTQKKFIRDFYETEISPNIIPLMIENIKKFPTLRDKSIFLGVVMRKSFNRQDRKYAIIEVPVTAVGRFIELPSRASQHDIMLLEDAIISNLPDIFRFLGYDEFRAHIFKFTRDAELDIDTADNTSIIQKLETGLKNRKKGTPVRFTYDERMDPDLLNYLVTRMGFGKQDAISPAGAIHNFRHFIDFPSKVFKNVSRRKEPFDHPLLLEQRISDVIMHRDVMLSYPYHNFTPTIDLIREAAFDPDVVSIKITCYRLAAQSKIINALINAVRNGKEVTVMLELKARFDEEANMEWKQRLEDVGATVLTGFPNMKVHAKLCVIKKRKGTKTEHYGFVSTGNLNEKTARIYADHCLLTSNKKIMADINRIFAYLENPKSHELVLQKCTTIIPSPYLVRTFLVKLIDHEIAMARKGKKAEMIIKMNSLSDIDMIQKLYEAARAGVVVKLIVRGIFCMLSQNKKFKHKVTAISIVDEYLEHARVFVFHNGGKPRVFLSSADWMLRNIEHRVEATCPVLDPLLKNELIDILNIQLSDNVKARILDNELKNKYVHSASKKVRSQEAIYHYLINKKYS